MYIAETEKPLWPSLGLATALYLAAVFVHQNTLYDFVARFGIYFTAFSFVLFPLLLLVLSAITSNKEKGELRLCQPLPKN